MIDTLINTVSISDFNRGLADKIFSDVKRLGAKVVMKNNVPECILISPEDYMAIITELHDTKLLALANERLIISNFIELISEEEHKQIHGITKDSLNGFKDIEFE